VEPPASQATRHNGWLAFVSECQAATDARMLSNVVILGLSLVALAAGGAAALGLHRRSSGARATVGGQSGMAGWPGGWPQPAGAGWSPPRSTSPWDPNPPYSDAAPASGPPPAVVPARPFDTPG
jgi:hypothetical protein